MRDVQGSAGVGVREQTLEHELAERKWRVHVHQQNRTMPLLLAFQRGRAREASAVRRNAARLEQERWDVRVRYSKDTHNNKLQASSEHYGRGKDTDQASPTGAYMPWDGWERKEHYPAHPRTRWDRRRRARYKAREL